MEDYPTYVSDQQEQCIVRIISHVTPFKLHLSVARIRALQNYLERAAPKLHGICPPCASLSGRLSPRGKTEIRVRAVNTKTCPSRATEPCPGYTCHTHRQTTHSKLGSRKARSPMSILRPSESYMRAQGHKFASNAVRPRKKLTCRPRENRSSEAGLVSSGHQITMMHFVSLRRHLGGVEARRPMSVRFELVVLVC